MFYTLNTRLLGVIVSLSLSLITLAGFLIYLLIVTRTNTHDVNNNANNKLTGLRTGINNANSLHGELTASSSSPSNHHNTFHHHQHHSAHRPSSSSLSPTISSLSFSPSLPAYYENESSSSALCSTLCPEKTYKDYLCDVKFVMLVSVNGLLETYETTNGTTTKVYSISIKKTFKKSLLFIIAFRTQRITVTTSRGCSRETLKPGHLYFVTGRVKGLTALVDPCDLTIDWTSVNETLKEEIRLFFNSVIGSCNNSSNVINNNAS